MGRGRQCGVGYLVYHVQIFSPSTLQELKVEEIFLELPWWEVTHFLWMIDWENMLSKSILVLSLQLIEDKQRLGGQDYNIPT